MLIEKISNLIARLAIISLLALLIIGLNPESASASYYAQTAWPALHRDSRNSDSVPFDGPASLEPFDWEILDYRPVLAAVTIGPRDGLGVNLYITAGGDDVDHLYAYSRSGVYRWGKPLDASAVFSSATVDVDDDIYISDSNLLCAFHPDGVSKWEVLSEQVFSSAITPDGYLVVVTQYGLVKVHERLDGDVIVQRDLELYYDGETLPVTNTPAVNPDPQNNRIYITTGTAPGTPDEGRFFGIDFDAASGRLDIAFEKTIGVNSQTSPAISPVLGPANYVHVYAADNNDLPGENYLYAFDAGNGDIVWQYPLSAAGGNCPGSPSVGRSGLDGKVPIYFLSGSMVVAIKDNGESYEESWRLTQQYLLENWKPEPPPGEPDYNAAVAGSVVSVATNYLYAAVTFGNWLGDFLIARRTFVFILEPEASVLGEPVVVGEPVEVRDVCWGSLTLSRGGRVYVTHGSLIGGISGVTALRPVSSLALAQSRIQSGKVSGEEALSQLKLEELDNAAFLMSGALNQLEVVYAPIEDAVERGEITQVTADNVLQSVNEALTVFDKVKKAIEDSQITARDIENASKELSEGIEKLNEALALIP